MNSIRELYRTGTGPSSSHTMAPRKAAELFRQKNPNAAAFQVTLYGSLAATGKGHLTDEALHHALAPLPVTVIWLANEQLPFHPNGMRFEAFDSKHQLMDAWEVYSTGGGELKTGNETEKTLTVYPLHFMDDIIRYCESAGKSFWEYVLEHEDSEIWSFFREVWQTMQAAMDRGIQAEGVLPGGLGLSRKAWAFFRKASMAGEHFKRTGFLSAYALAVAEENAAGGVVVTAPTCGSCGVLPATLRYARENLPVTDEAILRALATAGLIGNLVKTNASISGAQVGCQGEIGVACAMAAGALTQLMGGTVRQIEYAAEMGLEHHLGLTCDPVAGLVQIPCIERNAVAATRAFSSADYALFTDGTHLISFDQVVSVMLSTGHALPSLYRETSTGGLAVFYKPK